MLRPFELHRPSTVAEAVDLVARLGDEAAVYAGGTELLLLLKEGRSEERRVGKECRL